MDSNQLSVISLFLTLLGLLGTFFAIHLGNWLREMLAIRDKWNLNKNGNREIEMIAQRECRYALRSLYNHVTWLISVVLSGFLGYIFWRTFLMLEPHRNANSLAGELFWASAAFVLIYLCFTVYFLCAGYRIGWSINREIKQKALEQR